SQFLQVPNILPSQGDQAGDCRDQLEMIVVKRILRAPSIEVNHPAHSIGKEQWNAESRPHSGRLQAGGLSEGAALEVVQQKASSFGSYLFQQGPAHTDGHL